MFIYIISFKLFIFIEFKPETALGKYALLAVIKPETPYSF